MLQNLIFWWNSCQEKKNKFSTKFLVKKKCEYVFRQGGTKINGSIKVVCVQFKLLRFVDKLAVTGLQKRADLELKTWPSLYLVGSSLSIGLGLIYTVDFWKFVDNKNARCPRQNYCTYLGSLFCVSTLCIVASPENIIFLFNKPSSLIKEVNRTKPSPSLRVPCPRCQGKYNYRRLRFCPCKCRLTVNFRRWSCEIWSAML